MSVLAAISKKLGSFFLFTVFTALAAAYLNLTGKYDYRQFFLDNKNIFIALGAGLLIFGLTNKKDLAAFATLIIILILTVVNI